MLCHYNVLIMIRLDTLINNIPDCQTHIFFFSWRAILMDLTVMSMIFIRRCILFLPLIRLCPSSYGFNYYLFTRTHTHTHTLVCWVYLLSLPPTQCSDYTLIWTKCSANNVILTRMKFQSFQLAYFPLKCNALVALILHPWHLLLLHP